MSHYAIAVFKTDKHQSLDYLLAPYDESIRVAPYISTTKAELIKNERENMQRRFDKLFTKWQEDPKAYESQHPNPDHIKYLRSLPTRMKWTDEQVYREATKYYDKNELDKNGDVLSTYNPDSKWDWYEVGGLWKGMLIRKGQGAKSKGCNEAYVRHIDFEAMRLKSAAYLEPYEKAMKTSYMEESFMREKFPTEEEYIKSSTSFETYAVVTPDGKWHSAGNMGWWGMSSETPEEERAWRNSYYERFIKPALENNWYLVIVDCHI